MFFANNIPGWVGADGVYVPVVNPVLPNGTQVLDILNAAARSVGALESGEQLDPDAAQDALGMLNDMVASWANSKMLLPCVIEAIFEITPNVYQYTIGPGGVGPVFTGSIDGFVLTVTQITSGAMALGQQINVAGAVAGTIVSFGTGSGGLGTYNLDTYQEVFPYAMTASYERPIRVNSGFVRVATIDYPIAILNLEDYERIGLKILNGPWPSALYYQPAGPIGNLTFWPVPAGGEMHIYVDTILRQFNSIADFVVLPQGYNMALRYGLAELLMPEYGRASSEMAQLIVRYAAEGRALIKRTNMAPQQYSRFDPALINGPRTDAGWILSGGFNR